MIENLPIKIDEVGRVVIPKKIRKKYDIKKDSFLLMIPEEKSILFTKQNKELELTKLVNKFNKIETLYNFDIILLNKEKILYTSQKYEFLKDPKRKEKIVKVITEGKENDKYDVKKLTNSSDPYYYSLINFDNYTKYLIIIFYKDEKLKKIASLIPKLLS